MYKQFRLNEFESGREINKTFHICSPRGGTLSFFAIPRYIIVRVDRTWHSKSDLYEHGATVKSVAPKKKHREKDHKKFKFLRKQGSCGFQMMTFFVFRQLNSKRVSFTFSVSDFEAFPPFRIKESFLEHAQCSYSLSLWIIESFCHDGWNSYYLTIRSSTNLSMKLLFVHKIFKKQQTVDKKRHIDELWVKFR